MAVAAGGGGHQAGHLAAVYRMKGTVEADTVGNWRLAMKNSSG
jgi:hypothetical protein